MLGCTTRMVVLPKLTVYSMEWPAKMECWMVPSQQPSKPAPSDGLRAMVMGLMATNTTSSRSGMWSQFSRGTENSSSWREMSIVSVPTEMT